MLSVAPIPHNHVIPATTFDLFFFAPRRETVTTGKGSLVPLDKLKLLISNVINMKAINNYLAAR